LYHGSTVTTSAVIELPVGGGLDRIILMGVDAQQLSATDFIL